MGSETAELTADDDATPGLSSNRHAESVEAMRSFSDYGGPS
jgi:hypothetical protein